MENNKNSKSQILGGGLFLGTLFGGLTFITSGSAQGVVVFVIFFIIGVIALGYEK